MEPTSTPKDLNTMIGSLTTMWALECKHRTQSRLSAIMIRIMWELIPKKGQGFKLAEIYA